MFKIFKGSQYNPVYLITVDFDGRYTPWISETYCLFFTRYRKMCDKPVKTFKKANKIIEIYDCEGYDYYD